MEVFTVLEVLKTLSHYELTKNKGNVACPFSFLFSGPLDSRRTGATRKNREQHCFKLCGQLYPKIYQYYRCPCWIQGKRSYVKRRFWQQLEKARKEPNSCQK